MKHIASASPAIEKKDSPGGGQGRRGARAGPGFPCKGGYGAIPCQWTTRTPQVSRASAASLRALLTPPLGLSGSAFRLNLSGGKWKYPNLSQQGMKADYRAPTIRNGTGPSGMDSHDGTGGIGSGDKRGRLKAARGGLGGGEKFD